VIDRSYPVLFALHLQACQAVEATGLKPDVLQFPSELPEVLHEAYAALRQIHGARLISLKAGVMTAVWALCDPAEEALVRLVDAIRDEARIQRRCVDAAE
jgi:hypothetical protein